MARLQPYVARLQPYEFSGDQREELLNSAELVWRWESNFGGEGDDDEGGGDGGGRGRGRERGGVNTAAEAEEEEEGEMNWVQCDRCDKWRV